MGPTKIESCEAMLTTATGTIAALLTTVAYFPQLKKCWDTGKADDLSLKMFIFLALGVGLWVVYGVLQHDIVIIAANSVSLLLLVCILYFKVRGSARC
jgi:MtN3 and saliva related transmembrane protein